MRGEVEGILPREPHCALALPNTCLIQHDSIATKPLTTPPFPSYSSISDMLNSSLQCTIVQIH